MLPLLALVPSPGLGPFHFFPELIAIGQRNSKLKLSAQPVALGNVQGQQLFE